MKLFHSTHAAKMHIVEQNSRRVCSSEFPFEKNKFNDLGESQSRFLLSKSNDRRRGHRWFFFFSDQHRLVPKTIRRSPNMRKRGTLSMHHPRFTSWSFTRHWLRLRTVIHTRFLPLQLCHSYTMVHCTLMPSMYVTSWWLTSTMLGCLSPPFLFHGTIFPHSYEFFSLSPGIFCGEAYLYIEHYTGFVYIVRVPSVF